MILHFTKPDVEMPRAGDILAYLQEIFPPKSTFSVDDIPDLTGRVIIVTGANRGVGRETAKALLLHNGRVYLACRSQEAGEKTIAELKEETGKEGLFLKLDLANLKSVKSAAEEFLRYASWKIMSLGLGMEGL